MAIDEAKCSLSLEWSWQMCMQAAQEYTRFIQIIIELHDQAWPHLWHSTAPAASMSCKWCPTYHVTGHAIPDFHVAMQGTTPRKAVAVCKHLKDSQWYLLQLSAWFVNWLSDISFCHRCKAEILRRSSCVLSACWHIWVWQNIEVSRCNVIAGIGNEFKCSTEPFQPF